MSIQAVSWALEQYIPKPIAKLVLVSLANHANHTSGLCYPSVELIAHEASCSVRSAQRYIRYLAERGFIKVEERFKDGRQLQNTYWLLIASSNPPARSSGGGDSVSPLSGQPTTGVTPGGDTAVTPINHHNNHQLPPLSPNAVCGDKPEGGHSIEDKRPSSRAAPPAPIRSSFETLPICWKDRGRYEIEIILRLGNDGGDMLSALPDWRVNSLCQRQRDGILGDDAIAEIKTLYLETKSRSSFAQSSQPKESIS